MTYSSFSYRYFTVIHGNTNMSGAPENECESERYKVVETKINDDIMEMVLLIDHLLHNLIQFELYLLFYPVIMMTIFHFIVQYYT